MSDHHCSTAADTPSSSHHTTTFDHHTTTMFDSHANHTQHNHDHHHHHHHHHHPPHQPKNPPHHPPYRKDTSTPSNDIIPSDPPPTYGSIVTISDLERQSQTRPRPHSGQTGGGLAFEQVLMGVFKCIFFIIWIVIAFIIIQAMRRPLSW